MPSFKLRSFLLTVLCVMLLAIAPNYYAAAQLHYSRADIQSGTEYAQSSGQQHSGRQYGGTRTFGEPGRNGRNGRDGRSAPAREEATLRISDGLVRPVSYDLAGDRGSSGENGDYGEPARSCRVPRRPPYSLQGANGGSGGSGGNGGNGSNGTSALIYYTDPAALKQVVIDARGGQGGQGGQGAAGEEGCECAEPEWIVNFCDWELLARRTDIENAETVVAARDRTPCRGVRSVDESENAPAFPNNRESNTAYEWVYQGVTDTARFRCRDGERGRNGEAGRSGTDGGYGQFRLVPRADIPEEITQRSGQLSTLLGQTVQLVKNVWVDRQDLRTQLNSASTVPSSYTYLRSTERPQFRLEWAADATPEGLGVADTTVSAAIATQSGQVNIALDIPGTLDYAKSVQNGVEVATVTGGFSPSRVSSFRVERVSADEGTSQLVLVDEGDIRGLIPQATIEVTLLTKQSASGLETSDYRARHSVTFTVSPNSVGLLNSNIEVAGNVYTLDLGAAFSAWLKAGYVAAYDINIQQTTNSGVVYDQQAEVEFQVGSASA